LAGLGLKSLWALCCRCSFCRCCGYWPFCPRVWGAVSLARWLLRSVIHRQTELAEATAQVEANASTVKKLAMELTSAETARMTVAVQLEQASARLSALQAPGVRVMTAADEAELHRLRMLVIEVAQQRERAGVCFVARVGVCAGVCSASPVGC
jgi:hypothetical protein